MISGGTISIELIFPSAYDVLLQYHAFVEADCVNRLIVSNYFELAESTVLTLFVILSTSSTSSNFAELLKSRSPLALLTHATLNFHNEYLSI